VLSVLEAISHYREQPGSLVFKGIMSRPPKSVTVREFRRISLVNGAEVRMQRLVEPDPLEDSLRKPVDRTARDLLIPPSVHEPPVPGKGAGGRARTFAPAERFLLAMARQTSWIRAILRLRWIDTSNDRTQSTTHRALAPD